MLPEWPNMGGRGVKVTTHDVSASVHSPFMENGEEGLRSYNALVLFGLQIYGEEIFS